MKFRCQPNFKELLVNSGVTCILNILFSQNISNPPKKKRLAILKNMYKSTLLN